MTKFAGGFFRISDVLLVIDKETGKTAIMVEFEDGGREVLTGLKVRAMTSPEFREFLYAMALEKPEQFGSQLQALRLKKGWSESMLAEAAECQTVDVVGLEAGTRLMTSPHPDKMLYDRLLNALGATWGDLSLL